MEKSANQATVHAISQANVSIDTSIRNMENTMDIMARNPQVLKFIRIKLGDKGGNVVMLEGTEGNFAAIHRTLGFEEAIKENPNIKIIAVSQPPDWEGTTAIQVAVKLMNGEQVDKCVKTPVKLVTRENVSEFKGLW